MSWFSSFWSTTEADVVKIITFIKTEEQILVSDINKALKWLSDNSGTIADDINQVLNIIQIVGIADPRVDAAVTAAHAAVAALDKYAAAYKSGTGTPQAVLQGYEAYKQAQQASAGAMAAAVSAPTGKIATLMS